MDWEFQVGDHFVSNWSGTQYRISFIEGNTLFLEVFDGDKWYSVPLGESRSYVQNNFKDFVHPVQIVAADLGGWGSVSIFGTENDYTRAIRTILEWEESPVNNCTVTFKNGMQTWTYQKGKSN